jgi:hypothetical protein
MGGAIEGHCDNCGAFAAGREQWMIYEYGIYKQFICFRCLAWMRCYAIIAFTLLGVIVFAIVGVLWWL